MTLFKGTISPSLSTGSYLFTPGLSSQDPVSLIRHHVALRLLALHSRRSHIHSCYAIQIRRKRSKVPLFCRHEQSTSYTPHFCSPSIPNQTRSSRIKTVAYLGSTWLEGRQDANPDWELYYRIWLAHVDNGTDTEADKIARLAMDMRQHCIWNGNRV